MRTPLSTIALAAALALPWTAACAQSSANASDKEKEAAHASHHVGGKDAADSTYAEGEVRKVDKDAGKITLRHGPIPSLDMPPMSMVFRAKEPAMLEAVKAGDKVRFKAEKIQGAYTITEMQPAK